MSDAYYHKLSIFKSMLMTQFVLHDIPSIKII